MTATEPPPIHTKTLVAVAFQVFFVSLLISYFDIHVQDTITGTIRLGFEKVGLLSPLKGDTRKGQRHYSHKDKQFDDVIAGLTIFTPYELSRCAGQKGSKGIYLGLLGKVYDVSKGEKHYGPGGSYHHFAGKDATRAFVTGDFTDKGLTDDARGLSPEEYLGIEEWSTFYAKDYDLIGYVKGTYYDASGRPTQKLKDVRDAIIAARAWRQEQQDENARFPGCNSEWAEGKGGRVWCTNKSGGVVRDWVGVPRRLFMPGSTGYRCACVNGGARGAKDEFDGGDLGDPKIKMYKGCNPKATSCKIPDNDDDDDDE